MIFYRSLFSFLLLLTGICVSPNISAQSFLATASPGSITMGEYVTLRYSLENIPDIENIQPPAIRDFKLVSGPSQESSMSTVNGVVSQTIAVSYILQPTRTGTFNIGPGIATGRDKKLRSNSLIITVVKGKPGAGSQRQQASPPNPFSQFNPFEQRQKKEVDMQDYILKPGENVAAKVEKNMLLKLETSKNTCYVGEPILATYDFYTRLKSESNFSKNPSFNGFSVIDMQADQQPTSSIVTLNGREYTKYTIRKVQLYPLLPGTIPIEVASMDNDVQFLRSAPASNSRGDIQNIFDFGNADFTTQHVVLSSKPGSIIVKPLPEKGKPAFFHGAVGDFRISAEMQKQNFSSDESGVLSVIIEGKGNLHLLTAPEIKWPANIDGYEPAIADNINKDAVPIFGNKVFTYNFTVNKAGKYKLPPIEFSYFDPVSGLYKTAQTRAFEFTVTQGKLPIKLKAGQSQTERQVADFLKNNWYILAALILAGLFVLVLFRKKKKPISPILKENFAKGPTAQTASAILAYTTAISTADPLQETSICLAQGNCDLFYVILNKELKVFVGEMLALPLARINKASLEQAFEESGLSNELLLSLQDIFKEIDYQVYTPGSDRNAMQQMYSVALDVVENMRINCKGRSN